MKDPLGVSPNKGNQGTTRSKEKILLTSVGIETTTSGLDLPLLCRLSYEVGQRKSGTIMKGIEWSLRAFASMRAVRLFLRARAVTNFFMRAASTS